MLNKQSFYSSACFEMLSLTKLMDIKGSEKNPVRNLRFESLTFSCATWLEPSGNMGYIADQSGNCYNRITNNRTYATLFLQWTKFSH
jgi:hypothetical protein